MTSSDDFSVEAGNKGNANLVYILYLASLVIGVTGIVGVVMAYLGKDEADPVTKSHYLNQIHIFWKALAFSLIGLVLMFVLIGFLVFIATAIWYIIRTVKGMQLLAKGEPYPNPQSWGI